MAFEKVPLERFADVFLASTELSSEAIGGQVVSVSDEFFAEASQLLLTEPAPSFKGQFGPNGAIYSGWESRRHNPTYDWCIIRLGTAGRITGFDIDTSHFNGNEAPQVSVEGLHGSLLEEPQANDARWSEILPRVDLGPNARHLFTVNHPPAINYVKLNMYPDGGIARFRAYGHVLPGHPTNASELFDLAHVFAGGCVEYTSDQHFGIGANLILPGRGKNMGGGWETKRSRQEGHKDWVIIKLGLPGILEHVEIDTAHFKGNFPESCEIHASCSATSPDWTTFKDQGEGWTLILPRTKLGPHRQHYFQLENTEGNVYTHVKVTIHPDGGLQRIRILGRRAAYYDADNTMEEVSHHRQHPPPPANLQSPTIPLIERGVPVLPLTAEAFAPFGQVIQAYHDVTAAPKGTKTTPANAGSAVKFHKLSLLESSYRMDAEATAAISVYRCQPSTPPDHDFLELKVLERHPFTNQAFIPMGQSSVLEPASRYIIVVAKTGTGDRPDLGTLRAFVATGAQGVVYGTAVWHQPMTVLDRGMDFACVETQIGNGSAEDCEILELGEADVVKLKLPRA